MNRLKLLRERQNLSQTTLAKLLNISRQSYNFYENEKREPDISMLIRIANFFDVSLDYLLGRSNTQDISIHPSPAYSPDELDLLKKYRALDETRQEAVRDFIDASYAKALTSQKNTAELVS